GEVCTLSLPCFDETFPGGLSCVSGKCMWDGIYLPGESCVCLLHMVATNTVASCNTGNNYNNGGCAFGSCGSDNKCTFIALNCNSQFACANRLAVVRLPSLHTYTAYTSYTHQSTRVEFELRQ